nr:hypothetical protein [Bacteroidota bacterium]
MNKPADPIGNTKQQIFFTFEASYSGFTDLLWQLNAVHKLGRHLGFTYYHKPLQSQRSSLPPGMSLLINPGGFIAKVERAIIKRFKALTKSKDIFTFLGINEYLKSLSKEIPKGKKLFITIELDNELIHKHHVNNFDDLINHIHTNLRSKCNGYKNVVISFKFRRGRAFIFMINDALAENPPELDFKKAFNDKWRDAQRTGLTTNEKKKMLIHIRQGDTATVRTPWNTYIPVWDQSNASTMEFDTIAEIGNNRILFVEDFNDFFKRTFSSRPNRYSTQVFSDGFELAFLNIFSRLEKFNFTDTQREAILSQAKTYDKSAFQCFEHFTGVELNIGEKQENLKKLIHSIMQSDIIITGTQNWMVPKFISLYFSETDMPVLVLLYKTKKPPLKKLGFSADNQKIILVDLTDYDPEAVNQKLISLVN